MVCNGGDECANMGGGMMSYGWVEMDCWEWPAGACFAYLWKWWESRVLVCDGGGGGVWYGMAEMAGNGGNGVDGQWCCMVGRMASNGNGGCGWNREHFLV